MKRIGKLLPLLLLLPTPALAADFQGVFEMDARYSNQRKAAVKLIVVRTSGGEYVVSRRSKFTSARYRSVPEQNWVTSEVSIDGPRMVVTYQLNTVTPSMIAALSSRTSRTRVVDTLLKGNTFTAVYFLSSNKKLKEILVNNTRHKPHHWWRWISSSGKRKAATQPGTAPNTGSLDGDAFTRKAFTAINEQVQRYVEERYEWILDFTDTPDEEAQAKEEREEDRAIRFSRLDQVNPDEVMEDSLDDGEPLLDKNGDPIPRDALEVWQIDFEPAFTDYDTVFWTFVFDRRTGDLVHKGEIKLP